MSKTQAGRETWAFICFVVAPALPPVATKTAIKDVACRTFKVGKEFPASRVDEAAQERCGWKTKAAFEARAKELNLRFPDNARTARPCDNDGEYIDRLRTTAARLRHTGTEFGRVEADNLERIIQQIEGH